MKKAKIIIAALALASVMSASAGAAGGFEKTRQYGGEFKDINSTDWFAENVSDVYELGLMDGVSADRFDAENTLTVAQGITLATRLHSIYSGKTVSEINSEGGAWYEKYVIYALDNGITETKDFNSYDDVLQSYQMVELFAKALPEEFFPAINDVKEIPDVSETLPYYDSVMMFYNAGILNGNDDYGTFYPTSSITRKRAAAIIGRIALPETRLTYSLKECTETFGALELFSIADKICEGSTLDDFTMVSIGGVEFSAAEYRYFRAMLATGDESDEELKEKVVGSLAMPAAIVKVSEEQKIGISYELLREFYKNYYTMKASFGNSYSTYLSMYSATDKTLCRDELLYALYSAEFNALFGENGSYGYTKDSLIELAHENDYICAKHILISSDTENAKGVAEQVLAKAKAGEDFDELIKEYGEDPGMESNPNGYYFTKGEMVKPFEDAAYALEEGQISDIVETVYGYHIIMRCAFSDENFLNSSAFPVIVNSTYGQKGLDYFKELAASLEVEYSPMFDQLNKLLD